MSKRYANVDFDNFLKNLSEVDSLKVDQDQFTRMIYKSKKLVSDEKLCYLRVLQSSKFAVTCDMTLMLLITDDNRHIRYKYIVA